LGIGDTIVFNIYYMKKKIKINITLNKNVLEKIDKLSTNRSRLIEYILLEYLNNLDINTGDIIL
jgi:metal-responsive CopG/Arc/MetJ family transcriptional regulator